MVVVLYIGEFTSPFIKEATNKNKVALLKCADKGFTF